MNCMKLRGMAKSVDLVALLQEFRDMRVKLREFMAEVQDNFSAVNVRLGVPEPADLRPSRRVSRRPSRNGGPTLCEAMSM